MELIGLFIWKPNNVDVVILTRYGVDYQYFQSVLKVFCAHDVYEKIRHGRRDQRVNILLYIMCTYTCGTDQL